MGSSLRVSVEIIQLLWAGQFNFLDQKCYQWHAYVNLTDCGGPAYACVINPKMCRYAKITIANICQTENKTCFICGVSLINSFIILVFILEMNMNL